MTIDLYTTKSFDWTAQIDNLADAVGLLSRAGYHDGFWVLPEAQAEAKEILWAMARLRELWCPADIPAEAQG